VLQTNDRYWIDFIMSLLENDQTRRKTEAALEEMRRRDIFEKISVDPVSRVQIARTMQAIIPDRSMSNACRCYAVKLYAKFADVDPLTVFEQSICAEWLTDVSEAFVAIAMMEALTPRARQGDEATIRFIKRIEGNNEPMKIIADVAAKALGK